MNDLYRQEVVENAARRLDGEVILATPLSTRLLTGLAVGVILAGVIALSCTSYTRRETVVGVLAPDQGLIRLKSRQEGVVQTLSVREGEAVATGSQVAAIRASTDNRDGDAGLSYLDDLGAERAATEAEAEASREALKIQRDQLQRRRGMLGRELLEARRRTAMLEESRTLAQRDLERAEALAKQGFYAAAALDKVRAAALSAAQDASESRAAILGMESQVDDVEHQLATLPATLSALEAKMAQARATLGQRRSQAESASLTIVKATVGGLVAALPIEAGQSVAVGDTLAVLTPRGSRLVAELYVPSRAAGQLRRGQEVRLMYQAFPFQSFGAGKGSVRSISQSILLPQEVSTSGVSVNEPVFKVKVDLESDSISAYSQKILLKPGMLLSADVIIERRSLLRWLFDPIFAAGRR